VGLRLFTNLTLALLVVAPSVALAANCRDLYAELAPRGVFLSSADSVAVPQYLVNGQRAYRRAAEYLRAERSAGTDAEAFTEMLKASHRDLVLGEDGRGAFSHPGSDGHSFNTINVRAGEFRAHVPTYRFRMSDSREKAGEGLLRELARDSGHLTGASERVSPSGPLGRPLEQREVTLEYSIRLPSEDDSPSDGALLSKRALSFIRDKSNGEVRVDGFTVRYPPAAELPKLTSQMGRLYGELSRLTRGGALSEADRSHAVDVLADYVQLGAVAHLFERVNMSLVMIQANAALERLGMPQVYHGALDLYANALDSASFRSLFRKYLSDPANHVRPI